MEKHELLNKIKQLEGLTHDERAYLVELINTKKKYGLVWEDKPEDVEEQLRTHLPVLKEVVERRIMSEPGKKSEPGLTGLNDSPDSNPAKSKPLQTSLFGEAENQGNHENPKNQGSDSCPNHILIEGDNLHALTALTFTHEGAIDVIYIDPPYNTGNKDFKYNDSFVDREDSYRHSKWLSFMDKRLRIAKRLLSEKGVIFISIDDNEINQLKLLCDEIFDANNFVGLLPTVMNLKGNQDQFCFAGTHEYTLVYAALKSQFKPNQLNFDSEDLEEWDEDEIGPFKKGAPLRATGTESYREDRPLMFYPILIDSNNNVSTISKEEHQFIFDKSIKQFDDEHLSEILLKYNRLNYEIVLPRVDSDSYGRWRWGYNENTINRLSYDVVVTRTKNGISLYKKQRPELGDLPSKKPKTIFYKPEYSSGNGTSQLKEIMNKKVFDNPKPLDLIKDLLTISSQEKRLVVLDIFAGSGTTLHATMQLNAEDGGSRQCILVTNNENKIAEEVCYERNRRVIQGYTNSKGEWVPGLTNNNLRYYKTEFVGRGPSLKNKRELTKLATELLCIKEDCYNCQNHDLERLKDWQDEVVGFERIKKAMKDIRVFSENDKKMMVIYNEEVIEEAVALIKYLLKQPGKSLNPENQGSDFKVYVFSPGQYPFTEEFEEVLPWIKLCALPDAIYKAYMNILPKKQKVAKLHLEDETEETETEN